MPARGWLPVVLLAAATVMAACGRPSVRSPEGAGNISPPSWIRGEPEILGRICAVGMSEETFYKDDALRNASENARRELARTLSVEVQTLMVDLSTSQGPGELAQGTVLSVTEWATQATLEQSEIIGTWFDRDGVLTGGRPMTYVLCCIPREVVRSSVQQRANDAGQPLSLGSGEP